MNRTDKMIKRCRALALAGVLGLASLGNAVPALAAGPGDDASRVTEISAGGPGDPGNKTSSNSTPNTNNSNNNNNTNNNNNSNTSSSDTTANANAWKKVNGTYQMPDGSAIQNVLHRGIDVSRWQEEINWSQVAKDDISFVMLGTRSKGAVDPYFHKNIQNAAANGIKVGVYIYSLATTTDMAVQEADFVLNLINDYPISYPVAFDMEDSTQGNLSKSELAAIANAFCKRISQAGYYPIIYANENWLKNKLDMSQMNYPVWVARYSARPTYQNPVMWQATSSGSVNGIKTRVDIDFQFKDFSSVIPADTWRTINGKRYYYANYQKQKNAWAKDGDDWYYMDKDGLASTGWITVAGASYYLDTTTGKMKTGWQAENGKWYYLGSSGAVKKGWINDNGTWYYTGNDGVMQTGWVEVGGKRYYLENSGKMLTGWTSQNGKWYYLGSSGDMLKGWINDNGTWYYTGSDGVMQTGWLTEAGSKYYLKGSGAMATGWRQLDGAWYYFNGDGRMATGMIDAGGIHYYLDPSDGRMVAGRSIEINGTVYQAGADGALSVQSQENSDSNQNSQDPGNTNTGNNVSGSNTGNTGNTGNNVQITPVNPSEGSSGSSNSGSSSDDQKVTGKNGGPGVKKDSANTGNSSEITTGQAPG
ncbi:MAG: glycoside hydrolase [Clostridium sp.]|nr:glycoside hydrolase [Clostridium sp.]